MIKAIYQPQGVSSHMLARDFGKSCGEKATHTGTLDPMAEGVMIILTGDDRFKKQDLSDVKKTYQFEILWGVNTDSLDLLGLITDQDLNIVNNKFQEIENLEKYLGKYLGELNQKLPKFSAKRVKGESAFDLAKRNEEMEDHFREVEIFETNVLSLDQIKATDLKESIIKRVNNVKGDFRQDKILVGWKRFFKSLIKENKVKGSEDIFYISKCEVTASKRTYIRALVRDLAEDLGIPATVHSILRTKNGQYGVEDCTDL
jgi:tRNA pseudouridine(55) synthase